MTAFADPAVHRAFGDELVRLVRAIDGVYGARQYLLIGAYARDVHVLLRAGITPPRATADVDICIAVPDEAGLRAELSRLASGGTLRTRRTLPLAGTEGLPIDILPIGMPEEDGVVTVDDVQYDVRGLEDALRHAEVLELAAGVSVLHPTAAAMIGLKIIAWAVRRKASDARDVATLLDLCSEEPLVAAVWEDPEAEEYDLIPELAGPFLMGLDLADTWGPAARGRMLEVLDPEGPLLDGLLVPMPPRHVSPDRADQAMALRQGILRGREDSRMSPG